MPGVIPASSWSWQWQQPKASSFLGTHGGRRDDGVWSQRLGWAEGDGARLQCQRPDAWTRDGVDVAGERDAPPRDRPCRERGGQLQARVYVLARIPREGAAGDAER